MLNAIIVEDFKCSKRAEYIQFIERLGVAISFSEDKWVCDMLRRSPAEIPSDLTIRFNKIPEQHRDMVKYFSAICFIHRKSMSSVKTYVFNLVRFFKFWSANYDGAELHLCDEFIAAEFRQHLDDCCLAEGTKTMTWRTVNAFFKTMNKWNDMPLKNPFTISPFHEQRRFDNKYIPENVALKLDTVFKADEIALHIKCAYWILRLIPSRIGEVVGMRIDCLKHYNGHYVLFIPTWKQNGGWREPIIRSIHLEEAGIAGYLIDLIKKQQDVARQLQEHMPDNKKDALFSYRQLCEPQTRSAYYRKYLVPTDRTIRAAFQSICAEYNITDKNGRAYEITTHQFRHNGITDRLASGFTSAQIAEMTGHHGSAMIIGAYAHLNLLPETIIEKQEYVLQEAESRENRYILFGGRILNMEEQLEKRLLRNVRAHKVRGGICSDITGCKSDMWNCLDCEFFVPDAEQLEYYEEQAMQWREKCKKFSNFPIIKGNAEKNTTLYERVIEKLKEGGYLS